MFSRNPQHVKLKKFLSFKLKHIAFQMTLKQVNFYNIILHDTTVKS